MATTFHCIRQNIPYLSGSLAMSFPLSAKGCAPIHQGVVVELEPVLAGIQKLLSEKRPIVNVRRQADEITFQVEGGGVVSAGFSPAAMVTSGVLRFRQENEWLKIDYEISFKVSFVLFSSLMGGIALIGMVFALANFFAGKRLPAARDVIELAALMTVAFLWLYGGNWLFAHWRFRSYLERAATAVVAAIKAGQPVAAPKGLREWLEA
jgi:hypothetical protein